VVVNCGAIPGELLESELFGHLKGSFTGAHQDRRGLVTAADGGTLFLDEVGEMPPAMQVKLLRFVQEGTYLPVGGRAEMSADVRIIAASHRDLESMTTEGSLREDFYYRLKGMVLRSPALSDRIEDIAPLAVHFTEEATKGQQPLRLSQEALTWTVSQEWPGNVRELKAVMTCAAALANSTAQSQISAEDLAFARTGETAPQAEPSNPQNLAQAIEALERRMITAALAATNNNHSASARQLGMSRVGLLKKMTRLGLR
jgi:two-component system NtrC family response regulator